jgi:hypothetical protein
MHAFELAVKPSTIVTDGTVMHATGTVPMHPPSPPLSTVGPLVIDRSDDCEYKHIYSPIRSEIHVVHT